MRNSIENVVIPSLLFTVFCAFMYIMFAIKLEDKAEEKAYRIACTAVHGTTVHNGNKLECLK